MVVDSEDPAEVYEEVLEARALLLANYDEWIQDCDNNKGQRATQNPIIHCFFAHFFHLTSSCSS